MSSRVSGQCSEEFALGVGVHQGSVLSPLLFILVLEVLSCEFNTGVAWELLYADDLLFITDTQEECISKLKAWKAGMESKRLHVNIKKTKFLVSGDGPVLLAVMASANLHPVLTMYAVGPQDEQWHNLATVQRPKLYLPQV